MRIQGSHSLAALNILSTSLQSTAHNFANLNTEGFRIKTQYSEAEFLSGRNFLSGDNTAGNAVPLSDNETAAPQTVNVSREVTNLISTERAWEANLASISTTDEMLGFILNTHT